MNQKTLHKAARVVAKIGEIAHWIAAVGALVGLVLALVMGPAAVIGDLSDAGREVSAYGFEVVAVNAQGELNMGAIRLMLVVGIFLYGLMAMVFRNVYLILKGSETATPFQPDNVRMVREIGIFLIAQPVVGIVANIIGRLILGPEVEISVSILTGLLPGLVVLCLSQAFARGVTLESDVDGLL